MGNWSSVKPAGMPFGLGIPSSVLPQESVISLHLSFFGPLRFGPTIATKGVFLSGVRQTSNRSLTVRFLNGANGICKFNFPISVARNCPNLIWKRWKMRFA